MTRTLRRLARIQRLQQDEARNAYLEAERVRWAHTRELDDCERQLASALADPAGSADERMRRHTFSLRQEMQRRQLQARADKLDADVEVHRGQLLVAATRVKTTETITDRLEARALEEADRRTQRELDEAGILSWSRGRGGAL